MGCCSSKEYDLNDAKCVANLPNADGNLPYHRGLDTSDGSVATVLTLLHTRKNVRIKINEWSGERRVAIRECSQRWANSTNGFQGYTSEGVSLPVGDAEELLRALPEAIREAKSARLAEGLR